MTNKYKEAFQSAEQEIEEKSIEQLKLTVKAILQKKKDKEEERDNLDEEIKLLKQDIEDFKSGRLDKIKERHETNEVIERVFPITINIIKQEIIAKPWTWVYEVYPRYWGSGTLTTLGGTTGYASGTYLTNTGGTYLCSGTNAQTFTTGAYQVNTSTGGINVINL